MRSGDNHTEDGETQELESNSAAEDSEALEGGDNLSLGNQTSLGEETPSQTADGSVEGTESVVSERRRSSLAVRVAFYGLGYCPFCWPIHSWLAGAP